MDTPKGNPLCDLEGPRARDAPGIRHRCRQVGKKPGEARPFFPSVSPFRGAPPLRAEGFTHKDSEPTANEPETPVASSCRASRTEA
jgi:hypothetical protein